LVDTARGNRGAPNVPQGLFGNRQRIEPGNQASNPIAPQANDARRQAIIAAREQQHPGAGPLRALGDPRGNPPADRFAPRPQGQPNPPRMVGPQGNPDRVQPAMMRGDHGMRGNAARFRPEPQPQPRVATPRSQPQVGRGGGRPQMTAPRPEPRASAPRFQPRFNGGNDRPRFQTPRPQPQIATPRPQAPRFGGGGNGGMRPAPQMNRPAFQPRAPQMARPAPQMARPAPPPRAAAPAAPRGGGGNGRGGDHKH